MRVAVASTFEALVAAEAHLEERLVGYGRTHPSGRPDAVLLAPVLGAGLDNLVADARGMLRCVGLGHRCGPTNRSLLLAIKDTAGRIFR